MTKLFPHPVSIAAQIVVAEKQAEQHKRLSTNFDNRGATRQAEIERAKQKTFVAIASTLKKVQAESSGLPNSQSRERKTGPAT